MFCLFYEFWNDLLEKILISNYLFRQLMETAAVSDFPAWQGRFLIENNPVLKKIATDENLHHFLSRWRQTRKKEVKRDQFINVLIRVGKLMGLKKAPVK